MNVVNQYNALTALEKSLLPASDMIDGRTENDWLFFLSEFAALINFYDNDNTVNGNWKPFLLKDPVFLLASIAKTKIAELHAAYLNTKTKISQLFAIGADQSKIAIGFNELLDQLTGIFITIKQWLYFMQTSTEDYDLKSYVVYQVRNTFGKYFAAIIALRQNLFLSSLIPGIEPVDYGKLNRFESQEELIWKQNRNKANYWETLGIDHPLRKNTPLTIFKAVVRLGDEIFNFFHTIIVHAQTELESLKTKKSNHPDTVLLRSFVQLLKIQQDGLNQISCKHQQFYYGDILKQSARLAGSDQVFICAELIKNDAVFVLPGGTQLDAGTDSVNNQVLFATTKAVTLNPANITNVFTLAKSPLADNRFSWALQQITEPGVVKKNDEGRIRQWDFLGLDGETLLQTNVGIAFASPMLLLKEGNRTVNFYFEYSGELDRQTLNNAVCYFSTQTGWLKVNTVLNPDDAGSDVNTILPSPIFLSFNLPASEVAIESFLIHPDGFETSWPMFKMEFSAFTENRALPTILSLTIEVEVSGLTTFELSNDNGPFTLKTPYPLLGPAPLLNSNFIVGNNEIFSKPFEQLSLALQWNKVPLNFSTYYKQYNDYIRHKWTVENTPKASWFKRIIKWIKRLFGFGTVLDTCQDQYHNSSFIAAFKLRNEKLWETITMVSERNQSALPSTVSLFDADADGNLIDSINFLYRPTATTTFVPDPSLQIDPLKLPADSDAGFVKMQLSDPAPGFGAELYPAIVYEQALENAWLITKKKKNFSLPANVPFVPILKSVQADYKAKQKYNFNSTQKRTYPLQCYQYTPFNKYLIYEERIGATSYSLAEEDRINFTVQSNTLSFFPAYPSKGMIFLEIENLLPAKMLTIYFELVRKPGIGKNQIPPQYYYLSETGWKMLEVLSDGTDHFSSSGILQVKVPTDVTNHSTLMPLGKYWMAIAVEGDLSAFPGIFYVKTNGIKAIRTGGSFFNSQEQPHLAQEKISKTKSSIPQLTRIVQPFSSFGGRGAEDFRTMNSRISKRIRTKDRVRGGADYFWLIKEEFSEIFYVKASYDKLTRCTMVYLVENIKDSTATNAYLPVVAAVLEKNIQLFLDQRISAFANASVASFQFQYVSITANVSVSPGFELQSVEQNITNALNIFLSPWIESAAEQAKIEETITDAQVLAAIKNIPGVSAASQVYFQTWTNEVQKNQTELPKLSSVTPQSEKMLLISALVHHINCIAE